MSQGSGFEGSVGTNNPDVMKIIEDYSKQNESKTKELEDLQTKMAGKKERMNELKKGNNDME